MWPEPELYNKCSEVRDVVRKEITEKDGSIGVKPVTGLWKGPVTDKYRAKAKEDERYGPHYPHDWLEVTHSGQSLQIDPTYVQFTGTEWSFDACISHAARYCVATGNPNIVGDAKRLEEEMRYGARDW